MTDKQILQLVQISKKVNIVIRIQYYFTHSLLEV